MTEAEKALATPMAEQISYKPHAFLNSGSSLVNLAISGSTKGGFGVGTFVLMVGDSSTGKTSLGLNCMAEACADERFENYRLIYDIPENGILLNIEQWFGKKLASRLEPPAVKKGKPKFSETVEELYDRIDEALAVKKPFIYIIDSEDSLTALADVAKEAKQRTARKKGGKEKGSFNLTKAKYHSSHLNDTIQKLQATGSIFIMVKQTRDAIGSLFKEKTRNGGQGLRFYAHTELWLSPKGKLKKRVGGKDRIIGDKVRVAVRKNRVTGWEGTFQISFYKDIGFDEVGSMIDWLVDEKAATSKDDVIGIPELNLSGEREELVHEIEEKGLEKKLRVLVKAKWNEIIEKSKITRKKRYE